MQARVSNNLEWQIAVGVWQNAVVLAIGHVPFHIQAATVGGLLKR
jgi:hypothetical protein